MSSTSAPHLSPQACSPQACSGWHTVARTAAALGFTEETFSAWHDSLFRVPAHLYRRHPFHAEDVLTRASLPPLFAAEDVLTQPPHAPRFAAEHAVSQPPHAPHFAAEVWAGWPFLLTQGLPAEAATHYALLRAEDALPDATSRDLASAETTAHDYAALSDAAGSYSRPTARRAHTLLHQPVPGRAAADLAHSIPQIRNGWVAAQRKWADAEHRAAQLRESVAVGRNRDSGGRGRR